MSMGAMLMLGVHGWEVHYGDRQWLLRHCCGRYRDDPRRKAECHGL